MKVECQERFMIRTPNLPINYLLEYEKQDKDIYEFIKSRKELDEFFKKALSISSPSLYQAYANGAKSAKKYQDLKISLLKYFLRSVGRPTPYGYYATVSMGAFGDSTELIRGKNRVDLRVDYKWINALIESLEEQENVVGKLFVKFNPLCFVSGDRMKNPYYTNYGNESSEKEHISENSIRNTSLIGLISRVASEYFDWEKLVLAIREEYEDVSVEQVTNTLYQLLKNEYLISNLRIPPYCSDALSYLIEQLERIGCKDEVFEELLNIQQLIEEYRLTENRATLEVLYEKMKKLVNTKQYLILNVGNDMKKCSVSQDIRKQLESFGSILAKIPVKYDATKKLKEAFMEQYGTQVEVPLIEIIDHNGFDGLRFIELSTIDGRGEDKIDAIIGDKIQIALRNHESIVQLACDDFKEVWYNGEELSSYDVNIFMVKEKEKTKLWVGPNVGSSTAGAMTQRFRECVLKEELQEYNKLYGEVEKNSSYEIVELREFKCNGTLENVVNTGKNYKYYMAIGTATKYAEDEITVDDVVVGLDDRGMYLRSKRLNKKLKFVTDNMLNPMHNSALGRFLLGISEDYEKHPLARLLLLSSQLSYKYAPRIELDDVVISPERWYVNGTDLQAESLDEFCDKLELYMENYKLYGRVYCQVADNRIIVDLGKREYKEILYQEYKKNHKLEFSELEMPVQGDCIVKDSEGQGFINECVFSIIHQADNKEKKVHAHDLKMMICEKGRRKGLCEDGWVYMKLYGIGMRSKELLTIRMEELLERLNHAKHFFIRYADEQGEHLRVRFQFASDKEAYEQLPVINGYMNELIEEKLITNVVYDTYYREINRYGGVELIENCEELFFKDSETVEKLLSHYDMDEKEDVEKVYMTGITFLLKNLTKSEQDMFEVVDSDGRQEVYRKEYRENAKKYMQYIENVLTDRILEEGYAKEAWAREAVVAKKFAEVLQEHVASRTITNTRENIILSIIHMYCNRMTGERSLEAKYLELVRDALYQVLQKRKYFDR